MKQTKPISFDQRKQLLKLALDQLSSDELYNELCSVEAIGPTVEDFLKINRSTENPNAND